MQGSDPYSLKWTICLAGSPYSSQVAISKIIIMYRWSGLNWHVNQLLFQRLMRARRYIGVFLCLRPELHGFKWIFSPSHRLPLSHRLCWACWTRTNDLMNISHTISPTNLMPNLAGREGIKPPSSGLESDIIIIIPTTYVWVPCWICTNEYMFCRHAQ